jgi:hypothetical protein
VKTWKTTFTLAAAALTIGSSAFAQTPSAPRAFVDVSLTGDRESSHTTPDGPVIRATVGRVVGHHDWRFEVDIPSLHVIDTDRTGLMYCAKDSSCGPGYVPSHVRERTEVRTVSGAVLYAQHLPTFGRVGVSLVAGGALESQVLKYSQQTDILDDQGRVLTHNAYAHDYPLTIVSGVIGADADLRLTSHLAITPQIRYHFFPYPSVSFLRPGVAVRWQF